MPSPQRGIVNASQTSADDRPGIVNGEVVVGALASGPNIPDETWRTGSVSPGAGAMVAPVTSANPLLSRMTKTTRRLPGFPR